MTIISGMGTDNSGFDLNGSGDLGTAGSLAFQPDGRSDLVVGATGAQHVYVFFGTPAGYAATPSITITGAVTGSGRGVANAGDLDGDGFDDLAISSPNDNGGRVVHLQSEEPSLVMGYGDSASGKSFGVVAIGSGVRGTSLVTSFIGNALPDLVLAGQGEGGRPMYIVNGETLMTSSGVVDIAAAPAADVAGIVKVSARFPANWSNGWLHDRRAHHDLDGNGYADFAVGEFSSASPGRVAVFY